MSQKNEVVVANSNNIEKKLIDEMLDVENEMPIMKRLSRMDVDRFTLKELTSSATFDQELYDHCRGEILLPAMAKVLHSLVRKAAGGSTQAQRTYLELMEKLNTKQDVNVNILQYKGLSDAELDRRLEAQLRKSGLEAVEADYEEEV